MGFRVEILTRAAPVALLFLGSACGAVRPPSNKEPGSVLPEVVPEVVVVDMNRRPTRLNILVSGHPALVSLWATWCEACKEEFDALNRLHQRVGSRALVVGVAVGEPVDHVLDFVHRHRLLYPQLIDEQFALADALGSDRVPSTIVVDRSGTIRFVGARLDPAALQALRETMSQ